MATKKTKAAPAAKVEETKAAPAAKVEEKAAPVAEVKAAEVKAEEKAAPAEKKPAAKKAPAKSAAKTTAKKTTAKADAEKKPAAKKAPAKAAAKPAAKKAPAKKVKTITVDDVVAKVAKRLDKTKAKNIEGTVAVDIKLYGTFEAHMYIEVKDGVVTVAPYDYVAKDFEAAVSVENAIAIADGKLTLADALADGRLYVFGNVGQAAKIASLF